MGGIVSKGKKDEQNPKGSFHHQESSSRMSFKPESIRDTNEKVTTMLTKKKGEVDKSGHTMTFEKYVWTCEQISIK